MRTRALLGLVGVLVSIGGACSPDRPEPGEELPGGSTTNVLLGGGNAFTMPLANLAGERREAFFAGNGFFNQSWVVAPASVTSRDGLGPTFNARACSGCHFKDGRGRPPGPDAPEALGFLLRLSLPGTAPDGGPLPDPIYGGQLADFSIPDVPVEGKPRIEYLEQPAVYADGTAYSLRQPTYHIDSPGLGPLPSALMVSPRTASQLIGLGLLEAVPEASIRALADPDDRDGDGVRGRPQVLRDPLTGVDHLGRFGWKAEQPTVAAQTLGAFLNDIGITSSAHPQQNCPEAQDACVAAFQATDGPELSDTIRDRIVFYGLTLAVPARVGYAAVEVLRGKALFTALGCVACHTPVLRTADQTEPPELAGHEIRAYSDLLLHDLGPGLADGRPSHQAGPSDWRTPPLWGIGRIEEVNGHQLLLHDGRARGIAEAVLWHAGEAAPATEGFRHLPAADRAALVRFVGSL